MNTNVKNKVFGVRRNFLATLLILLIIFTVVLSVVTKSSLTSGMTTGIFGLIFFGAFYFLPAIIGRNKKNATAILVLNIILGWTFIGWIVALIWVLTKD